MMNMIFRSGGTPKQSRPEKDPHESPTKEIAPSNGTAKALRLVYCDDKGKFRMDAEAVAALQLVKGPLGVVAVCGRARQGKSFILNQLLGRSSGFQVGPTHRPCTKGLWMWSIPIKRTSPDGSEYNLLLLDSEGIDAYDQTGTYSTQIFSLAVLLSSMFVYNQMGGIDEAALDRLSLVTEMTKHIRVRASQRRSTTDELGQFSPVFMWLLRDFYLDLKEGQRHITPREYLESALQPMPGSGKAIYAKNEIRDSIRSLFPDRHCFTLVRPLNDERDLQRLDQIQMEKMRPEFRTGLDQLTRFIFERTRPKQLGSTVMTGPLFAGLTQSFLDAINAGAVPTIATSWQNVEENECRRAEDLAVEAYTKAFDKSVPPEQMALQETHEAALQIALSVYNNVAVGLGPVRIKYEKSLISVLKKRFEEYKQRVSIEAELKTVKAVDFMEENLRAACHSENVTFDQVIQQLDGLIQDYEKGVFGPAKWQKLAKFLHHSIEGLLGDFVKRIISQANAQYAALEMRFNSLDDKLKLTAKHAEAAHRESLEWKRMYEAALADYKSNADLSASQYTALQSKLGKLEEQKASLTQQLEAAMKEAFEWQGKYDHIVAEKKTELERQLSEFTALQSRCSAAEARLAAAREQSESAKEEAAEWRRKHDAVVAEARSAAERANVLRERANKQAQLREDAIRAEFSSTVTQKEAGLRELRANLEKSEQAVIDMSTRILNLESKLGTQEDELATVRAELRHAEKVIDTVKSSAATFERQAEAAQQEKTYAEEKLIDLLKKLEELEEASQRFEKEARRAVEEAEAAKELATSAEREKLEALRLAVERLVSIEKFQRISESMGRERDNLAQELEHAKLAEQDALSKAQSVEKRLDEREHEMQELLQTAHEQRASTVHVLEGLLATERAAHAEANARADALSVQLQSVQAKLDSLQKELTTSKLNEAALETKVRAHQADSSGRRKRGSDDNMVSGHDTDTPLNVHQSRRKRMKLDLNADNGSSFGHTAAESDSNARYDEDNGSTDMQEASDYRKFTVSKLKQELTNAGFGAEVFQARNASKKDILALYTKHVLKK